MRYQTTITTDAPETLTQLQPGQWIRYGAAQGRFMGHRNGCAWIAWGGTATKRFSRFAAAFALTAATVAGSIAQAAESAPPRGYVLNQWGGVVSCDLSANPVATHRMRAYCAGADIPAADPARFDCRKAEVESEYRWCGIPLPGRR